MTGGRHLTVIGAIS